MHLRDNERKMSAYSRWYLLRHGRRQLRPYQAARRSALSATRQPASCCSSASLWIVSDCSSWTEDSLLPSPAWPARQPLLPWQPLLRPSHRTSSKASSSQRPPDWPEREEQIATLLNGCYRKMQQCQTLQPRIPPRNIGKPRPPNNDSCLLQR